MIEDKLAQAGLILRKAAKPAFAYVPVTLHDGVAYVSGQCLSSAPLRHGGVLA
jgi:hypothetical protein